MCKRIKDNKGQTITGALVAVGLAGVLALGVSSSVQMMLGGISGAQSGSDALDVLQSVKSVLATETGCSVNLGNGVRSWPPLSPSDQSLNSINFPSANGLGVGAPVISVGSRFKGVTVSKISLTPVQTLPNNSFLANLEIDVNVAAGAISPPVLARVTPVQLIVDGAGKVQNCYTSNDVKKTSCEALGGLWNAVNGTCTKTPVAVADGSCPAGQLVGGFDGSNIQCVSCVSGPCTPSCPNPLTVSRTRPLIADGCGGQCVLGMAP